MFADKVKIFVKAGNGGNGCVSFHREKYISHGGPDGGDGGKGGSIIVTVDKGETTLTAYRYKRKFTAENGGDGKNSKFHGKNAPDLYLKVPAGTVIKDAESGLVIHDMSDGGDYVLCRGGNGGWGNVHFATPTRQIPRFAKAGLKGEEREVIFELKVIADVGLIGLPNVGKSSILSCVTSARPKIANYHFTTLSPGLGVVESGEHGGFVMADIPGLIEGASDGAGLGHDFLRHIERCRLLLHVVDVSGSEGRNPIDDIKLIDKELAEYSEELSKRPQIIVANKLDCADTESDEFKKFVEFAEQSGRPTVYISAAAHNGLDRLIEVTAEALRDLPPTITYEEEYAPEEEKALSPADTVIRNVNGVYCVEGRWLENLMGGINFEDRESLMYFQRMLKNNGIIDALEARGCEDGDTVSMYDFEFDFVK